MLIDLARFSFSLKADPPFSYKGKYALGTCGWANGYDLEALRGASVLLSVRHVEDLKYVSFLWSVAAFTVFCLISWLLLYSRRTSGRSVCLQVKHYVWILRVNGHMGRAYSTLTLVALRCTSRAVCRTSWARRFRGA
jgi:hypothetical protein